MNKTKLFIGFMLVFFATTSCTKEVVVEECKKRYVTSLRVLAVFNSDDLDLLNGPDLRLDMAASASGYWSYSSNVLENVDYYPVNISFSNRFLLSHENWSFRLVDEDLTTDELICEGSFNPYNVGENGVLTITKDGVDVIELYYDEE